jgi:hypothetical protein
MASQNEINSVAPYSGIAATISEIISPVVISLANGLVYLAGKLVSTSKRKQVINVQVPAPHVAMIMVPGNFVTDAFTRR